MGATTAAPAAATGLDISSLVTPITLLLVSFPLLLQTMSNAGHDLFGSGFLPPSYKDIISPRMGTLTRFSIWFVLLWTLLIIGLAFSLEKDTYEILGITHSAVIGVLFLISLIKAPRLWLGSWPLFLLEGGVALILFKGYKCKD